MKNKHQHEIHTECPTSAHNQSPQTEAACVTALHCVQLTFCRPCRHVELPCVAQTGPVAGSCLTRNGHQALVVAQASLHRREAVTCTRVVDLTAGAAVGPLTHIRHTLLIVTGRTRRRCVQTPTVLRTIARKKACVVVGK